VGAGKGYLEVLRRNKMSVSGFIGKMPVIEVGQVISPITVMLGMSAVRTYEKRTEIAK
jgi:hypothetical protein